MPLSRISSQDSDPFHFYGKRIDKNHPRWRAYRQAIRRYPDATSCLTPAERQSDRPDLLAMDWRAVGTGRGAEVCMFRIFRSLGSIDLVKDWLVAQHFAVSGVGPLKSERYVPESEMDPVLLLGASWDRQQYRQKTPSLFWGAIGFDPVIGYSVTVDLNRTMAVVGVRTGTSAM